MNRPFLMSTLLMLLAGCSSVSNAPTESEPTDDTGAEADQSATKKKSSTKKKSTEKEGDNSEPSTDDAGSNVESDAGASPAPKDSGVSGPVFKGGKITVTCPKTGFHEVPPITISSMNVANMPRCSSETKSCVASATTAGARSACLSADTTPPVVVAGETLDCKACENRQGSYCLASTCANEFSDYACCAQSKGEAACADKMKAITDCASTTQKTTFEACLTQLTAGCFP